MENEFLKNWSSRLSDYLSESITEIKPEELNLDLILDKISDYGMESLTPKELRFLNNHSKQ